MTSSRRSSGFPYNFTLMDLTAGHSHTIWCAVSSSIPHFLQSSSDTMLFLLYGAERCVDDLCQSVIYKGWSLFRAILSRVPINRGVSCTVGIGVRSSPSFSSPSALVTPPIPTLVHIVHLHNTDVMRSSPREDVRFASCSPLPPRHYLLLRQSSITYAMLMGYEIFIVFQRDRYSRGMFSAIAFRFLTQIRARYSRCYKVTQQPLLDSTSPIVYMRCYLPQ